MEPVNRINLWLRWVLANGLGEMLGLGLTFVVMLKAISGFGNQQNVAAILASFLVAVGSGAIEATMVSLAQWWALHLWFPMITRRAWWLATLVGALAAYVLGYLPSTLMSINEQSSQSQAMASEPAQWVVLLLAAGLGAVGGAVLSFGQWLCMRGKLQRASSWIPGNMLGWALGMPLIFWAIDTAQKMTSLVWVVVFIAGMLLVTGLLVGAIHGAFLVRIAVFNGSEAKKTGSIISPS